MIRSVAACCALVVLAGCASGISPRTSYYTLSAEAAPAAERASSAIPVAVERAVIPEMVDRPQIVVRTAANRVEISDFNRWGEPLRDAIPRVIAENLGQRLGPRYSVAAGGIRGAVPGMRVMLDVQKLDAALGGSVTLDVLWRVRAAGGDAREGRSLVEERATEGSYAGVASAASRALARVAQDIAAAVEALSNQPEG